MRSGRQREEERAREEQVGFAGVCGLGDFSGYSYI